MKGMTVSDTWLLLRKIAIGIVITLVPLAIVAGGLWVTQHHADGLKRSQQTSTKAVSHAD